MATSAVQVKTFRAITLTMPSLEGAGLPNRLEEDVCNGGEERP